MKEASHSHKSGHTSQPAAKPFFQRKADEQATASSDFFFQAVQPKLSIGAQNDPHEKEADRVADQVVKGGERSSLFEGNNALQTKSLIHRQPFIQKVDDDDEIRQKSGPEIQKSGLLEDSPDAENGELMAKSEGSGTAKAPASFESGLSSSKGGGAPLSPGIRPRMEAGIGADFSNVRIHNNASAAKMSNQIGAKAFTHGSDVYFNEGEYDTSSEEGQHLIAHELTHTVQQGAVIQRKPRITRTSGSKVQRGLLDGIGDFFSSIRDRVVNFIRNLPGYFLFTVLLGEDPISDEVVERNGMNFIKGFLLLLPNGQQKYDKLREEGALDRSAQWIDQQLTTIESIRNQASRAFEEAKDSIGPSDILDVSGALRRIRGKFNPVISRATNFARNVARQVLQFLKEALLNSLVNFVKERTRAYPLLRVLLGKDPITQEEVPRTIENVIHGFLMLSESGESYYNKMVETGALARAVNWMRIQLNTLPSREEVVGAFSRAWQEVTFDNLLQPVATFQRIYGILSDPVGRILRFVGAVAYQILIFIKDAMLSWLRSHANDIPGYHLLTVFLGRDVFTNQPVPRTATNLIRGFMGLIPGGEQQFQQMQESGVIPRLADRINSAVDTLGITWNFIRNLFISIWRSMTITDLLLPLVAFGRIIARFREPISRLFAFIRVVITAIIEVLLRMMNFPIDLIGQIINNAMQAYQDIKRDPIGFLKNLMRAARKGFQQFFDNFVQHLIGGVTGWLFSELEEAGITPPADISFRSILGMAMEVLGITVDNIFARLAERIGQERVDRIRSVMDRLTGIWSFVRDVMDRGAVAIWERIQQQLSNLWDIVVEGIRNWIVTRIVQRITARLLTMLDPTGIMTVVNGFITFFRAVQSFIEQLTKILQVINTFIQGVGEIARGNIQQAADFLENALSRALPVAIAFLANQVGLRGLGRRIGEMIGRAREAINSGIDWLIDRAIQLGSGILNMLRRGAGAVRQGIQNAVSWWQARKEFSLPNGERHSLYFQGSGASATLMVASNTPSGLVQRINARKSFLQSSNDPNKNNMIAALDDALRIKEDELDPLISNAAQQNTQNESTSAVQADIDGILERIKAKLIIGKLNIDDDLPLSNVTYTMNQGRAKQIIGNPLTKNPGNTTGESADNSVLGSDWTFVSNRVYRDTTSSTTGRKIRVVDVHATHLLNARFHGPSTRWNLAIASRYINNPMLAGENNANQPFDNGEELRYTTDVEYFSDTEPSDTSDDLFDKKKLEFLLAKSITLKIEKKNDEDSYTTILSPTSYGINNLPGINVPLRRPSSNQILNILRSNKSSETLELNGRTYYKTISKSQVVELLRQIIENDPDDYVTINIANVRDVYQQELEPSGQVHISGPPLNETFVIES